MSYKTQTHIFFIVVNNYFVNVISSNVLTLCILSKLLNHQ